ncbi:MULTISPECIES: SDR family oxidoreductase [Brevibacillus]|uniref:SDR family oxidoreductase n=1 Tax=Brevibacillus TaxID=55080 RepID=UPI001E57968D|nr:MULTISPECIES: SDR family oxidoreductase [Brevibacillus]MCE0449877.1 SDR family oxidoreductase [Brevibacillus sp. AF8]UKK97434.1 SDR family oxidoreductase [Brevibacillus brevis]
MTTHHGLHGKIAIVTGASRLQGIGAAICKMLASHGADIFHTYWTAYDHSMAHGFHKDEPAILQEEIRRYGVRCAGIEVDLSQSDAYKEVLDAATAQLGEPSILVNNACYSTNDGYEALNIGSLDAHYAINVRATTMLSVEFARRFSQQRGGRIINMTSGQSKGPMVGEIAYAATKGAVDALTTTLAAEVATRGITVNAVNPGPTDSGWMNDEIKHYLLQQFPFGRIGQPEDAARLVAFLASDEAEWITGQIMHSEGGFIR